MEILNAPQPVPAPQLASANHISRTVSKAPAAAMLQQVAVRPVQDSKASDEKLNLKLAEKDRYDHVLKGAKKVFKDVYVVSDQTFTIFKDPATGEYITRFTSLRDGKVTYIPEQEILDYMESSSVRQEAMVQIDV